MPMPKPHDPPLPAWSATILGAPRKPLIHTYLHNQYFYGFLPEKSLLFRQNRMKYDTMLTSIFTPMIQAENKSL
jgi:hypothetical protein